VEPEFNVLCPFCDGGGSVTESELYERDYWETGRLVVDMPAAGAADSERVYVCPKCNGSGFRSE